MNIKVETHKIEITKDTPINAGEYNITPCTFEFSSEYDNLIKKAVFTDTYNNTVNVDIENNQCKIPYEVLESLGKVVVGVYGYETEEDNLVLRYSPKPSSFQVEKGSFKNGVDPKPPKKSDWEILVEQVEDNTNDIETINDELSDKVNRNELSNVALSGNYNDLSNKPNLNNYATKVELNEEATNRLNKDNDLQDQISTKQNIINNSNKLSSDLVDDNNKTHKFVTSSDIANWNNKSDFSGSYDDLSNKPSINSVTLSGNKSLSDLGIQPAGNYITKAVNDLENYYKKSETYTQAEINSLISAISTMSLEVVQTLPTQDISTTTIYLVPKQIVGTNNYYDEYIYVSNSWEHIGSTDVDLTNYVKNTDYANNQRGGVVKVQPTVYGLGIDGNGFISPQIVDYETYATRTNYYCISKGTLENVLTNRIGDIQTLLDNLNTGSGV